jgi:hypothetical protein
MPKYIFAHFHSNGDPRSDLEFKNGTCCRRLIPWKKREGASIYSQNIQVTSAGGGDCIMRLDWRKERSFKAEDLPFCSVGSALIGRSLRQNAMC